MRLSLGALDLSNGKRYVLDGSEIPYPSLDSILVELPAYAQGDDAGAMRDALLATIQACANRAWADVGSEQNAFVSPRYASGPMLDIWGIIRKMPRIVGESDGAYRTRLLAADSGITPNAIKAAVQAAADQFNASLAFQEPASDGEFWTDNDPNVEAWCSFYQDDTSLRWNYDPTIPNQQTGGYWVPDSTGALFWIIMQLNAGSDALTPFFVADDDSGAEDPQDFYADDTHDYGYFGFDQLPLELQIAAIAQARKAFGVAFMLIEDPYLTEAF